MNEILIAFSLGLMSAPHCLAMCGSIASTLVMASQNSARQRDAPQAVNILANSSAARPVNSRATPPAMLDALMLGSGKLIAYGLLGLFAGTASTFIAMTGMWPGVLLRIVSALLIISIGLYIAGWWRGLNRLEAYGGKLWQLALKQISSIDLSRVNNKLLVGALWGMLPCGIVYSMLGLALTSGHPVKGAALMMSFGLGTMPFVLGTGGLIQTFTSTLAKPHVRHAAGAVMIIFGAVSLALIFKTHVLLPNAHLQH